jgi:hypothetical protein
MMKILVWSKRWFLGCMPLVALGCGDAMSSEDLDALQQGLTVRGVTAGTDATIRQSTPTTAAGNSPFCDVGVTAQGTTKCLIRWPLGDIPPTATVTAVELVLFGKSSPNPASFDVLRAGKRWSEFGATWNTYTSVSSWEQPGAEGLSDHGSVVASFPANSQDRVTVQLNAQGIAMVQAWVRDNTVNAGIIVQPGVPKLQTRSFAIESSESASPSRWPLLRISYKP